MSLKSIAIIAHDNYKDDVVDWARKNQPVLKQFHLYCTGTTGGRIAKAVEGLHVTRLLSGPLGGDQQIGALAAEKKIDGIIFFIDPMTAHPTMSTSKRSSDWRSCTKFPWL